jgi:PAS domain S-box-containing protein
LEGWLSEEDSIVLQMTDSIPHQRADRTQLQQIIAGLTEGVIIIDPDQTIAWSNDTALTMHGVSTLEELGGTVDEYRGRFELRYRNRHKVPQGQYPMDRVVAGEAFSEIVVEVGRPGEEAKWTHRLRSLVLNNPEGEPDCLVLVLNDETDRYNAEERFEKAFNANPAPAIICRLSDLRYVKVNQGFQEMTGYSRDDVIGHSVYEVDVLESAENKELAIERLNEGRTIPQMEALLKLPDGGRKFVIVAGQPIEVGDEACMLFTFMDLEPRKKAESALRQSEERFSKSFRLAPVPTIISTLAGFRTLDINDAFVAATGYAAEEVIGRSADELRLWGSAESRQHLEHALEKAGSVRNLEVQLRTKEGVLVDCLISADTVSIHDQACVLSVLQDITERKRSEIELVAAIEAVMQDTSWFSRTVIEKLANLRQPHGSNTARANLKDLTAREHDVLGLICQGRTDEEIAQSLRVSRNTVRNQVASIYGKIGVHRRSAVIVWARERGFTGEAPRPRPKASRGKA